MIYRIGSILAILFLTISCSSTTYYYQLYKTSSNDLKEKDDNLVFENEDLKVTYNFWGKFGNGNFYVFNKTDQNIFIDKRLSHLIRNGSAETYFQNRVYTNSEASSSSVTTNRSSSIRSINQTSNGGILDLFGSSSTTKNASVMQGYAVSYQEMELICLPPKAGKVLFGYNLSSEVYRDCEFLRFPNKKSIAPKTFTKKTTPLSFTNYITYLIGEDSKEHKVISNKFWVSEVINYPSRDFKDRGPLKSCEEESTTTYINYYKYVAPTNFYIKYAKNSSSDFKH